MAKRELIYKDEAHYAVLKNASALAWCISNIKPAMIVDDEVARPIPQVDEYYIARIKYWDDGEEVIEVVNIYYVWQTGEVDFIPCIGDMTPVKSSCCAHFELLEKIDVEKYK